MSKTVILWISTLFFHLLSSLSTGTPELNSIPSTFQNGDGIQWITWEEASQRNKKEPRKIFVNLYTDWCGWCKQMDQTTYKNKTVVNYINENFYAVKFNGEHKEEIIVDDKTYEFVETAVNPGSKGYHEFAQALSMGRLTYPTVVFLNEQGTILQPLAGYKDAATFEMIMTYFGGDFYRSTPWDSYQKNYVSKDSE